MLPEKFYLQIESRIIHSGRDTRYKPDGYGVVLAALEYHHSKTEEDKHLSAEEIVNALCELSVMKYGPMAREVLEHWGIFNAIDIGNIVYNMIDIDLLKRDAQDSLDDFVGGPKLFSTVSPDETYRCDKEKIKKFKDS